MGGRVFVRLEEGRNAMLRPLNAIVENDEENGHDDENERSHTGDDRIDSGAVQSRGRTRSDRRRGKVTEVHDDVLGESLH